MGVTLTGLTCTLSRIKLLIRDKIFCFERLSAALQRCDFGNYLLYRCNGNFSKSVNDKIFSNVCKDESSLSCFLMIATST